VCPRRGTGVLQERHTGEVLQDRRTGEVDSSLSWHGLLSGSAAQHLCCPGAISKELSRTAPVLPWCHQQGTRPHSTCAALVQSARNWPHSTCAALVQSARNWPHSTCAALVQSARNWPHSTCAALVQSARNWPHSTCAALVQSARNSAAQHLCCPGAISKELAAQHLCCRTAPMLPWCNQQGTDGGPLKVHFPASEQRPHCRPGRAVSKSYYQQPRCSTG